MRALTLLASAAVVAAVLLAGAAANFETREARTAFALGVIASTFGYLVADLIDRANRSG